MKFGSEEGWTLFQTLPPPTTPTILGHLTKIYWLGHPTFPVRPPTPLFGKCLDFIFVDGLPYYVII